MKSFLKLIVSIVVILVVGFTTYFLLNGMENYKKLNDNNMLNNDIKYNIDETNNQNINEEQKNNNTEKTLDNNSNSNLKEEINEIELNLISGDNMSGDNSGDYIAQQLDEEAIKQMINKANMIRTQNNNETVINTIEDSVGIDIIGTEYQDLLNILETNELSVNVQKAGTMIYILPVSDFVNNQQYHYDEEGNLVLYVCELMGIGGEVRYYFNENQLIKREENIDGEGFMNYEEPYEIVKRSNVVYNKYFKQ